MAGEPLQGEQAIVNDYENDGKGILSDRAYQDEKDWIEHLQKGRTEDGRASPDAPFALAFSGGGIRAAAFQCGVLWRLAERGLLKDVTYMTAVSGGGYITMAYATRLLSEWNANPPQQGQVNAWYRNVVAKTVVQMQNNAGDFVRDCFRQSACIPPADGSGCTPLPRGFDVLLLVLTLVLTMLVHPTFFFLCFMFPLTVATETFFGDVMRDTFCAGKLGPGGAISDIARMQTFFDEGSNPQFSAMLQILGFSVVGTIVSLFLLKVPGLSDPVKKADKLKRVPIPCGFKLCYGLWSVFVRVSLFLLVVVVLLVLAMYTQIVFFAPPHIEEYCTEAPHPGCLDSEYGCMPHAVFNLERAFLAMFIGAVMMMPYAGSGAAVSFACLMGPIAIALMQIRLLQFRVFGVYTKQDFIKGIPFDAEAWDSMEKVLFVVTLVILPVYPEIRALLHMYYLRCLSRNYFPDGEDVEFSKLLQCPYCPFIVVTATSSDYKPPICGDDDIISELSLSPLHCGSEETGFVTMPKDRTIGKCAALTAAGCIDAVALTLSSLLTMRFWLEALNLSWGDYLIFKESEEEKNQNEQALDALKGGWEAYQARGTGDEIAGDCCKGENDRRLLFRAFADGIIWFGFAIMFFGFMKSEKQFAVAGAGLLGIAFFLSFFCFECWPFNSLQMSPFIRQLQQATAFCYRGKHPPPMLYCTDGGCRDCTTLLQLVRRREKRILLVLAASDPNDELGVLRVAIGDARRLELASFYNPDDPRRDVDSVFQNFQMDKTMMYIHLGISYQEKQVNGETIPAEFGHLFIVKNRLPSGFEGQPVEPHLTEEELKGDAERGQGPTPDGVKPFDAAEWEGVTTDKLGPFCCCDCTHTTGMNCGAKFPHGSFTGFLYLTPMWLSSLSRLAFDVSKDAVEKIQQPDLTEKWETMLQDHRGIGWRGFRNH